MQDWSYDMECMIEDQIIARGVRDPRVLAAMRIVPRHLFVDEAHQVMAYDDCPLFIGYGQTISQPYIVAYMTWLAQIQPEDHVLEVGLGSGYQTAVLAQLAHQVYSVEIVEPLFLRTAALLKRLGYDNIEVKLGDGSHGWADHAPYDVIMATAAPSQKIPDDLIAQLKPTGKLVLPFGSSIQFMYRITKRGNDVVKEKLLPVSFVRMTGDAA